jgi:hypothetical protein
LAARASFNHHDERPGEHQRARRPLDPDER